MNSNSLRALRGQLLREVITLLFFAGLMLQSATAIAPSWWSTQGIFKPQAPADDYTVANIGQLKAMAAKAAKEMNEQIQQGAGDEINHLIDSWRQSQSSKPRDDYAACTIGQLKAVAKLFHDRLAVIKGLDQAEYPWGQSGVADDYAPVNVGQLKSVFSFLVPYQVWRLGDPDNPSPDDLNGNGISDQYEASRGWNDGVSTSSGLSPLIEAWNNATNAVEEGGVVAGVYMKTSLKYGYAQAYGFTPLKGIDENTSYADSFVFYSSMSLNVLLDSSATTQRSYATTGLYWTNGHSSDENGFQQSLTAEIDVSTPIYTGHASANGVSAGDVEVSLAASMSGSRSYTSHDTGNSFYDGAWSSDQTITESWSGSNTLTGPAASALSASYQFPWNVSFTDGVHTFSNQTTTQTQFHGTTTSSTSGQAAFGYGAPSNTGIPTTFTRSEDLFTQAGNDAGSTTTSDSVGTTTNTWDKAYSYVQQLLGKRTLTDLISAAQSDLGEAEASELELKIAEAGDDDVQVPEISAYASALKSTREVLGTQYDYSFEYRVPSGITKGLSPVTLNWFEVTRHYDEDDYSSSQMSVAPRSATLLPGQSTSTYHMHPLEGFSGGHTEMSTALSGYVNAMTGTSIERITPTTAPPFVSCYIDNAQTDVVIDHEEQTAAITLRGIASDQLAAALPLGTGADPLTVDIYVNGGLAAEDVPLVRENWGYGDVAGHYHFDPVTVNVSLAERIVVEVETSKNLVGKTARSSTRSCNSPQHSIPRRLTPSRCCLQRVRALEWPQWRQTSTPVCL